MLMHWSCSQVGRCDSRNKQQEELTFLAGFAEWLETSQCVQMRTCLLLIGGKTQGHEQFLAVYWQVTGNCHWQQVFAAHLRSETASFMRAAVSCAVRDTMRWSFSPTGQHASC